MNYEKALKYLTSKTHLLEVKDFLIRASKAYYNRDSVLLKDIEYDKLSKMYEKITGEKIIGVEPEEGSKTVSVEHDYDNLVGTLDKAADLDEVKPFMERFAKVPNQSVYNVRLSLKFDGNSVTIEYDKNGNPKKALTRGKDGKGKDIINVFKKDKIDVANNFNLSLLDSDFAIKYEVIISYDDYDKLMDETGEDYANPRSTISGLLNCNEGASFRKYMTLIPLEMRVKDEGFAFDGKIKKLYEEELSEAHPKNWYQQYAKKVKCKTLDDVEKEIKKYYDYVVSIREDLPFMIDGIVVDMLNKDIIKKYFYDPKGYVPQHNFAVKLPYLEEITEVTGIDYCIGNTGRITPRIWFNNVEFNGTIHQKQQISNFKRFKNLNLGIGSKILVTYRHDCLSYITKVEDQPEGIVPFKFITKCPVCGGKISIRTNEKGEKTLASCNNPKCKGRLKGKIENFFIKMDIKGIKMNTIDDLYDAKILTDIESIFNMDYKKVGKIIGPKNAQNIKKAIEDKLSDMFDYELIGALGIESISKETSKAIFKEYNFDEIVEGYNNGKLKDMLLKLEGFKDKKVNYFIEGLEANEDLVGFLYGLEYKTYKDKVNNKGLGIAIAVSNWRPTPAMTNLLDEKGITVKSGVSSKVDYLVYGGSGPAATKGNKAKELNIPIISYDEFVNKYDI